MKLFVSYWLVKFNGDSGFGRVFVTIPERGVTQTVIERIESTLCAKNDFRNATIISFQEVEREA